VPPAILDEIISNKRNELNERKMVRPLASFKNKIQAAKNEFLQALLPNEVKLIAEIKPKSPSGGVLRGELNLADVVASYNRYAAAISVLTDKKYFDGSLELLSEVVFMSQLPVLCKDFVIDPYQCYEARLAGAHGVLLIVKVIDDELLKELHSVIQELGMTAVVEIQNDEELTRALKVNPTVILINNRNLMTFEIDLSTSIRLAPKIPASIQVIAASGFTCRAEIDQVSSSCQNFLVGSSIMQSENIDDLLSELLHSTTAGVNQK
jgi:indole-3-glycerol phosphate synthase